MAHEDHEDHGQDGAEDLEEGALRPSLPVDPVLPHQRRPVSTASRHG